MDFGTIQLVIVDPQNDFIDLPPEDSPAIPGQPGARYAPAMAVAGAHADMQRLAVLIDRLGERLTQIAVTLDSHHCVDIAHNTFWGVAPFTPITLADVREGRYAPVDPSMTPYVVDYLAKLEASGRRTHMAWPVHCQLGSWGHNVHAAVAQAYNRWELRAQKQVLKLIKGLNPLTESYSAIRAEVPLASDPSTQRNLPFLTQCTGADLILLAGEAGSHCTKDTVEDMVDGLDRAQIAKYVLLSDCMSPVPGFAASQSGFVADMRRRGMRIATSTEMINELCRADGP